MASLAPTRWRWAPRQWLEQAPGWLFGLYAGAMAFGVYFAMYAFRKPFAVASFAEMGASYKIALVIAQVVGYALAKLIGVKVIAELPANRRIAGIVAQVALAEVALAGFALVPAPWNIACLFADGLALGMVWGMVFAFVEGRRQSELIGAILCASFVLSSGVVKTVGKSVMQAGISDFWMPATTGLLFVPLLVVCLCGLAILPPPNAADRAERVERKPMDRAARAALFARYAPGLVALIAAYVMLTALRDFRDNFAAEIWAELGLGEQADIFAWTELPVSIVVLAALAGLALFRSNRAALAANLGLVGLGLALIGGACLAYWAHLLGPVAWMILLGGGLYLAYTPFNGMLFDRLLAAAGGSADGRLALNAGFLIYVADSSGYAGSVALLLLRNFGSLRLDWVNFLIAAGLATSVLGLVLLGLSLAYFARRFAR
jgi:hypothetical protein